MNGYSLFPHFIFALVFADFRQWRSQSFSERLIIPEFDQYQSAQETWANSVKYIYHQNGACSEKSNIRHNKQSHKLKNV
jgi:hypothetical protein